MWQYTGVEDKNKFLHKDFSSIELESRVQWITKLSGVLLESPVIPLSAEHSLPLLYICILLLVLSFLFL